MDDIAEVGHRDVPPDPSIADAVGRHHTLGTAIADLVDNSIDAHAERVHLRFLSADGAVHGLRVIDDGDGMDAARIDSAMTFAGRREYAQEDLGHFGLGLKAASLSQADVLDVYSRSRGGTAVGRRITSASPTHVSELDSGQVAEILAERGATIPGGSSGKGTVVEWRGVRTFLSSSQDDERTAWLDATVAELRMHLGLVLHRLIAAGRVTITIDEFDTVVQEAGASRTVDPIDPFGYIAPPGGGDVVALRGQLDGETVGLQAHVWPAAQADSPSFRLADRSGERRQGLYIYRNDRLLQAGGWNGIVHGSRDLAYARIVFDLDEVVAHHATINPEKSGVEFDADLREAVEQSDDGHGRGFRDYLALAEQEAAVSRRRNRRPITLAGPRRGLSPELLDTIARSVSFSDHGPIEIRWRTMRGGSFTEIDLDRRTLWMNSRYREALGANTGEADDAPLIKMLLLLLYSRFFEGSMLGGREREELRTWNDLIMAALDEELERSEYKGTTTDE
ncbi:ATP-binding protein [Rathayibacter caricis]|uniref:ATP-binding protein n=1 Tax=Rathayibacter caricis TaxID=110936 RepID=UPI001FB33963|nr:ATP-binding protein [Rathayibacter caricis]MCJ1696097.1 ATP-binding protein [Rathayibacter caricis]